MMPRTSLAALAAILTASACAPMSERSVEDYLAASPAAVSDYQRGKQDLSAGNYGLALKSFTNAVRRDPRDVAALNGQAISLAKLDRSDDAAAAFEQALRVDSHSAVTLGNYATLLERHGDHTKAALLLARLDPPPAVPPPAPAIATIAPEPSVGVPAPASAPPVVATTAEPKPALTISNASGQYRLARRLQHYLTTHGYAADRVANAARFDRTQTVLFCHAQSRQAAEEIRRALPASVKLIVLTSHANSIELVAGSDLNNFDSRLALAAPTAQGAVR